MREVQHQNPHAVIQNKITEGHCVILDGANATELQRQGVQEYHLSDTTHWGFDALDSAPEIVQKVHASYLRAGADVITTNTYAVLEAPTYTGQLDARRERAFHWMDMTRRAVTLARNAIAEVGKDGDAAVAFSIGGEIETDKHAETIDLLLRTFETSAPDLILFETMSLISDNLTIPTIEKLTAAGWPVWVSFRRCRHGVCNIYGQIWGGPEGDYFGRLARRLQQVGVAAILINCLPRERVAGTISWLRDFTSLPLGVYPNLGRHLDPDWDFDTSVTPEEFAALALHWRAEGAQLIGGCCGVGPAEIRALARALAGTPSGNDRYEAVAGVSLEGTLAQGALEGVPAAPWRDAQGRDIYPLPVPEIIVDPDVFVPTQGSYLIWKHLFNNGTGAARRCLDVGCGAGILSVQLALNGATHVTAIDIQKEAVANTLTNAFRNDVADRVAGEVVDLYAFQAEKPYDVIVASLYQMPTDPKGTLSTHRAIDFWGRNLLDHFITALPRLLSDDGVAYMMQVSVLGQYRTAALLAQLGLKSRVIDFNLFDFNPVFLENLAQIQQVEQLSDAYHLQFGDHHILVIYLIEVSRC